MEFVSEETRENFVKSSSLLQLACSVLEGFCFELGVLPVVHDNLFNMAVVELPKLSGQGLTSVVAKLNNTFKRLDDEPTCWIEDEENNILSVSVTDADDLVSH